MPLAVLSLLTSALVKLNGFLQPITRLSLLVHARHELREEVVHGLFS